MRAASGFLGSRSEEAIEEELKDSNCVSRAPGGGRFFQRQGNNNQPRKARVGAGLVLVALMTSPRFAHKIQRSIIQPTHEILYSFHVIVFYLNFVDKDL